MIPTSSEYFNACCIYAAAIVSGIALICWIGVRIDNISKECMRKDDTRTYRS